MDFAELITQNILTHDFKYLDEDEATEEFAEKFIKGDKKMKKKAEIKMGLSIESCKHCEMMNCAMRVMKTLQFKFSNANVGMKEEPNFRTALAFNHSTKEILINEELLMQAIIMANPGQERRKIRLISDEEFKKRRDERTGIIKGENRND